MGLFEKIFGKKRREDEGYTRFQLLNSTLSNFTPSSGVAWADSTVRAAVDGFARRAAIVMPRHIRKAEGREIDVNGSFNRILQYAPNPYSTAYKFYYRIAANYKIYRVAIVYPVWDETGRLAAMYALNPQDITLLEKGGEVFAKICFSSGKSTVVEFEDLIVIGSHFLDNDIFPSDNRPISTVLRVADTFNQSMGKFAELVAAIRGILEVNGAPKNEDLRRQRDNFVRDNLRIDAGGAGVVVTDNKYKYTPVNDKATPIPSEQLEYVKGAIYSYFGTNEAIVQNSAKYEEEDAYYKGELEPFFTQLSQALTNALFTPKEIAFGNCVVAGINTLKYAQTWHKLNAVKFLAEIGALTFDQALTTLGFPPLGGEDGARRIQTLNVVNAAKADNYQLGEKDEPKKEKEKETNEEEEENAD